MIPLDAATLIRLTGATRAHAEQYLPFLQVACKTYSITSPRRVVGFLSQIGVESANLSTVTENLNYSVDGLLRTFGRHRISVEDARRYGRKPGRPANRPAIAELLYGGAWGAANLGNTQPGDGAAYIGRGLKQLTGRTNYKACGSALGKDLLRNPDLLLTPSMAALSAGWFWHSRNLNELADRGDVVGMTRLVNGGRNGLAKRQALWDAGQAVFA